MTAFLTPTWADYVILTSIVVSYTALVVGVVWYFLVGRK